MRALFLFLLLHTSAGVLTAQVGGRIFDAMTGSGIEGALVRLSGGTLLRTAVSGPGGVYRFEQLEPASYDLSVAHPAYDPARIRLFVRDGRAIELDVTVAPRPFHAPRLIVNGVSNQGAGAAAAADSAALRVNLQRMVNIGPPAAGALGQLVLADVSRESPGAMPGGARPHMLYIWGSSAEQARVLIDGAAVNAPLHLGGILPPLDPAVLSRAEVRTGGTSARHDGGTRYIMDFATRAATDRTRLRTDVDLLSTAGTLETALGDSTGLLLGARRVNHELVGSLQDRDFGYGYHDLIGRADLRLGRAGRVAATTLVTRELIRLPRDLDRDRASWENLAAVLSWRPATTAALASTSFSRGVADLPLLSAPAGHMRVTADRYALSAQHQWTAHVVSATAGVELEHLRFARHGTAASDPALPGTIGPVSCSPSVPCLGTTASFVAPWGEVFWQASNRLSARAGLRVNYQTDRSRLNALPRLSLAAVNRAGTRAITLSAGRFSQVRALEHAAPAAPVVPMNPAWPGAATETRAQAEVVHANQLELHVAHRSPRTTLEAALLAHRLEEKTGPAFTVPGAETSWTFNGDHWFFRLGYTLIGQRELPHDSVIRFQHISAAAVGVTRGAANLHITGAYGRGLPVTEIVLERPALPGTVSADPDGELDDRSYVRLDALLSFDWSIQRGKRVWRLSPYARLVNGLNRRDALFYFRDGRSRNEPEPLAALRGLPVLGLSVEF